MGVPPPGGPVPSTGFQNEFPAMVKAKDRGQKVREGWERRSQKLRKLPESFIQVGSGTRHPARTRALLLLPHVLQHDKIPQLPIVIAESH